MRLFVAAEISPDVVRRISATVDELRNRASALAPRARIAWVPEDQLHVTVRFIGEVTESFKDALADALQPALTADAFDLEARGIGAFPERGAPRVIWAGLGAGVDRLRDLETEVTSRLGACGVAPEDRPYRPHVTLGRVKEPTGLRATALTEGFEGRTFGSWRVGGITLFHSRTSPKGHTYLRLQTTHLRSSV